MQTGRSEGHTEGNWVHSSSSGVGGGGEGRKDTVLISNENTSIKGGTDQSLELTCATAILIQGKPMTTL